MLRRGLLVTVILLLAGALSPAGVQAQACGPLESCSGGHRTLCPAGYGVLNCHFDCRICVEGVCHPGCQDASAGNLSGQSVKHYAQLLERADQLDVEELVRLGTSVPGRVFYNPARGAIQVTGCDGVSIAASIPMNSASARRVAAATLPDVSQLRWFGAPSIALLQALGGL